MSKQEYYSEDQKAENVDTELQLAEEADVQNSVIEAVRLGKGLSMSEVSIVSVVLLARCTNPSSRFFLYY